MSDSPILKSEGEPAARPIAVSVLGTGVFVVVLVILTVLVYRHLLERSQDEAELAPPAVEWTSVRDKELGDLEKAFWLDKSAARVHLPIDAAMEKIVKEYAR